MNRHRTACAFALTALTLLIACGSDDSGPTPPPPDKPDLVVSSIRFSPEAPVSQEEVTATVTVWNGGTAPAGASTVRVEVNGSVTCGAVPAGTLADGHALEVSCTLGFLATGQHQVRACADAGSGVDEGDEQNNCTTDTLTVEEPLPPGPDLIVETIGFVPANPVPLENVQARITVRNVGNQASAASAVRFEVEGEVACAAIFTPIIQAGESTTVNCDLSAPSSGNHTVRACADEAGVIPETYETNNCTSDTLRVAPGAFEAPPTRGSSALPSTTPETPTEVRTW